MLPTLRTSLASALLVLIASSAHARSMRFAVLPVDDQAGLAPEALQDLRNAVRGAIMDRAHIAVPLSEEALPPGVEIAGCERLCQYKVSKTSGTEVVLVLRVARFGGGLDLVIEAWSAVLRGPAGIERASGPDAISLVPEVLDATDRLLDRLPQQVSKPPPPKPKLPPPTAYVPYDVPGEKSPALAFVLELFLPSAGLFYDEAYLAATGTLAAMIAGMTLILIEAASFDSDPDSSRLAIGLTLIAGSRVYGLVAAPIYASSYNEDLRRRWESERRGMSLSPPERLRLDGGLDLAPSVRRVQLTLARF